MSPEQKITVRVIVSGHPTSVVVNIHQKVEQLVHEALQQTGNRGQPPNQWELRTTDGVLIDQNLTISAAGIVENMTLYLSPRAGAGGAS